MLDAGQITPREAGLAEPLTGPRAEATAEGYVARTCFKTGPPSKVGVELEWLVYDHSTPQQTISTERICAALADLSDPPLSGWLSNEPGGQLELSSSPAPLAECLSSTAADLSTLRSRLSAAGMSLVGMGLDPVRPPVRLTEAPRYVAMEQHFDRRGPEGRRMMCSTASVQVCLDAGADDAEVAARWAALYALAPVLIAIFANSPLSMGRPTGWRCSRQAVWLGIDPTRASPPADRLIPSPVALDPRSAYAQYAMDAQVLAIRTSAGPWHIPAGLTFRGWLRGDGPAQLPAPTLADLDYHLSTLFPPVRARGHLELRVIDAQPGEGWQVAAGMTAALINDPIARDAAVAAVEAVAGAWRHAARFGLADPAISRAGAAVVSIALAALRRAGVPASVVAAAEQFAERCTGRQRSPADDVLDEWAAGSGIPIHPIPAPTAPRTREACCR